MCYVVFYVKMKTGKKLRMQALARYATHSTAFLYKTTHPRLLQFKARDDASSSWVLKKKLAGDIAGLNDCV